MPDFRRIAAAAPEELAPGEHAGPQAHARSQVNKFRPRDISALGLSKADMDNMVRMMTTPEEELEYVTLEQWFTADYF
jgi:myosin-crossreactive antigen